MKTLQQLRVDYPHMKFARRHDCAHTKMGNVSVCLSWHNGIDTVSLIRATADDAEKAIEMFFEPEERRNVRVMPHPNYVDSLLLFNIREVSHGKLDQI